MSTYGQLKYKVGQGKLVLVEPLAVGTKRIRELYVTARIWKLLNGPWKTKKDEIRYSALYARLEHFISGGFLDESYLKWLEKNDNLVFEIISKRPKPSLRLLGRFVAKNVFVGLMLENRHTLGKKGSLEWGRAERSTIQIWNGLFNPYPPLKGASIHDFVSNAASKNDN